MSQSLTAFLKFIDYILYMSILAHVVDIHNYL